MPLKSYATWSQLFLYSLHFHLFMYKMDMVPLPQNCWEEKIRWQSTNTPYLGRVGLGECKQTGPGSPSSGARLSLPLRNDLRWARRNQASPHLCNHWTVTSLTTFPSMRNKIFGSIIFQTKRKPVLGILSWKKNKKFLTIWYFSWPVDLLTWDLGLIIC